MVAVEQTGKRAARGSVRNKRIARTRRQRGYTWEDTLVKRFNGAAGWRGFRLGSPSVALPDILALSNHERTLYVIEAKSGTGTRLQVPHDQIVRCMGWVETFEVYKTRRVVLAFKFMSKKRVGQGRYENRQLREFFKAWDPAKEPIDCVCTYEGDTYALLDGRRQDLVLADHAMPF